MGEGLQVSLAILAGGRSSRMGQDKADLSWRGKTFLQWQIEKGIALGLKDILVAGYRGSRCPFPVIPDRFPGRGPLAGMEACLRQANYPDCLVLSVDTPLVPVNVLKRLLCVHAAQNAPATLLRHRGREEPLIAVYSRTLAPEMERELQEGKGTAFRVVNAAGYTVFDADCAEECFANINRESDYRWLCQWDKEIK